jgi:hypothetical protein
MGVGGDLLVREESNVKSVRFARSSGGNILENSLSYFLAGYWRDAAVQ